MKRFLIVKGAKGKRVHRGTQEPVTAGSSSPSIPFDIPSTTTSLASSKRKLSQADLSAVPTTSSAKKKKGIDQLTEAVKSFEKTVETTLSLRSALVPTPASSTSAEAEAEVNAIQRLLESTNRDNWLSAKNVAAMVRIFQRDTSNVNAFMAIADNEMVMRLWVQQTLGVEDGNL
jgi:putative protein kinase ArgK-like GTPase of G3E family